LNRSFFRWGKKESEVKGWGQGDSTSLPLYNAEEYLLQFSRSEKRDRRGLFPMSQVNIRTSRIHRDETGLVGRDSDAASEGEGATYQ